MGKLQAFGRVILLRCQPALNNFQLVQPAAGVGFETVLLKDLGCRTSAFFQGIHVLAHHVRRVPDLEGLGIALLDARGLEHLAQLGVALHAVDIHPGEATGELIHTPKLFGEKLLRRSSSRSLSFRHDSVNLFLRIVHRLLLQHVYMITELG